jgi:ubiquinone/menaquinone biosynthesis C-methylase UbiE
MTSPAPSPLTTTRASYDAAAVSYDRLLRDSLAELPYDRAVLDLFADRMRNAGSAGPVADLGCGTGRVTSYLRALGLDVFGVDLSPGMVAVAREACPGVRFEVGTMTALDLPDASLTGAVAWYSLVHTSPHELPRHFAEFHRVLAPGGQLALAYKVGEDDSVHLDRAYGHELSLDVYRFAPTRLTRALTAAGFAEVARLTREPDPTLREKTPQAYVLARRE